MEDPCDSQEVRNDLSLAVPTVPERFFEDIRFFVSGVVTDQVEQWLECGGAAKKSYLSSNVTLCIAGCDADDDELNEASDLHEIPVVRHEWVTLSVQCGTRLPYSCFSATPHQLFSGMMITSTGLSRQDEDKLHIFIESRGGRFVYEMNRSTTHLIAISHAPSTKKYAAALTHHIKIVTPDWVTDCIRQSSQLSADIYHPRLLLAPGEVYVPPRRKKRKKKAPVIEQIVPSTEDSIPLAADSETDSKLTAISTMIEPLAKSATSPPEETEEPSNTPNSAAQSSSQAGTEEGIREATVVDSKPPCAEPPPPSQESVMSPASSLPLDANVNAAGKFVPANVPSKNELEKPTQDPTKEEASATCAASINPSTSAPAESAISAHCSTIEAGVQLPKTPVSVVCVAASSSSTTTTSSSSSQQQPAMVPSTQPASHLPSVAPAPQPQPHLMLSQGQTGQVMSQQGPQQSWPRHQWQQQLPAEGQFQTGPQPWLQTQPPPPQQATGVMAGQRPQHPRMLLQHQIIQQHISSLSPEERSKFTQMNPREKQQYLVQRGLLLQTPPQPTIRHTITLTDQQRDMLQSMDPHQRTAYIQKLQKEMQLRQQMMQRQPHQTPVSWPQQQPQQQQQQQQHQLQQQQSQQQQQQQASSAQQQFVHVGQVSNNVQMTQVRMVLPNSMAAGAAPAALRPTWSGETHPALAQVPHTPQQLQHLHRLQQQREQQQLEQQQQPQQHILGPGPRLAMQPQTPTGTSGPFAQPMMPPQQPPQPQQSMMGSPQQPNGVNNQKTKAALQNMLNSRLQQPGAVMGAQTVTRVMTPGVDVGQAGHLQQAPQQQHMVPHQQSPPHSLIGSPIPPGHHMYGRPVTPTAQAASPQPFMPGGMPSQRRSLDAMVMQPQQPQQIGGHMMGVPTRFALRMGVGCQPMPPRIQFHGHEPNTKLPPEFCLLGCIFHICDYPDDPEDSKFYQQWVKTIQGYGGEVEQEYTPRITHLLCKNQDSSLSAQALRDGRRLVTIFWLNDVIVLKKVVPPWKAIHFPLPANFDRPCEHMMLTLTGFSAQDRDRDWVKAMIRMTGAKFTTYFTKHNHALICKSPEGEKYLKAKEWKVPTVSVQWLNDVLFSNVNAVQCIQNPKYQNFRLEDPFRIDYTLVQSLIAAWKTPIRVTQETYQKFRANPSVKRKAEQQRLREEAKRVKQEGLDVEVAASDSTLALSAVRDPATDGNATTVHVNGNAVGLNNDNNNNNNDDDDETEGRDRDDGHEHKTENHRDDKKNAKVLFSGFSDSELKHMMRMCEGLPSIEITSQPAQATHLVMPTLGRTVTLLCAISHVRFILSSAWIEQSHREKTLLDEKNFKLYDPKFESKFDCCLAKTLDKPNRSKLFEGRTFYLTPSIYPPWKKIKQIIECAGGVVDNRRRKTVDQIASLNRPGQDPHYIIICCEEDLHLVTDVLKAKFGIFNTEFVMSAVLRSKMNFDLTKSLTTVAD